MSIFSFNLTFKAINFSKFFLKMESIGAKFDNLPEEVFDKIFCMLDSSDIQRCKMVSKSWKSAIENSVNCCDKFVFTIKIYFFYLRPSVLLLGHKYRHFKVEQFRLYSADSETKLRLLIRFFSYQQENGVKSITFQDCRFTSVDNFNVFLGKYQQTLENIDVRKCDFAASPLEKNIDFHEFPLLKTLTLAHSNPNDLFLLLFINCQSLEYLDFHMSQHNEEYFPELVLKNRTLKTVSMNLTMFRSIQDEEFCKKLANHRIESLTVSNNKSRTDQNRSQNVKYIIESQKLSLVRICIESFISLSEAVFKTIVALPNLKSLELQHAADVANLYIPRKMWRNESLTFAFAKISARLKLS